MVVDEAGLQKDKWCSQGKIGCQYDEAVLMQTPKPPVAFSLPNLLLCVCSCPQSTAALPFGTIVIIIIIWALVTIPLTVFGGIAGKNNR